MIRTPGFPDVVTVFSKSTSTKFNNNEQKKLLSQKKLFPFFRAFVSFLTFFAIFLSFYPQKAHAGFFRNLCEMMNLCTKNEEVDFESIKKRNEYYIVEPALGFNLSQTRTKNEKIADTGLSIVSENALLSPNNPTGIIVDGVGGAEDAIFVYEVKNGDTPSSIAKSFGVTVSTILWANDISNPNRIKIGDKLIILPVSGVKHVIKKNDSISGIAKKYGGDVADILVFNGLSSGADLVAGETIIIPDGELAESTTPVSVSGTPFQSSKLKELIGFFMRPILNARRSRGLHGNNGVDLINNETVGGACKNPINRNVPVFASAEGTVLIADDAGWNGGYGKYIVVAHNNGVQTLYAHLKQILVPLGKMVAQGETIGYVGSTGNSTGCHVHFEVRRAKNPF